MAPFVPRFTEAVHFFPFLPDADGADVHRIMKHRIMKKEIHDSVLHDSVSFPTTKGTNGDECFPLGDPPNARPADSRDRGGPPPARAPHACTRWARLGEGFPPGA